MKGRIHLGFGEAMLPFVGGLSDLSRPACLEGATGERVLSACCSLLRGNARSDSMSVVLAMSGGSVTRENSVLHIILQWSQCHKGGHSTRGDFSPGSSSYIGHDPSRGPGGIEGLSLPLLGLLSVLHGSAPCSQSHYQTHGINLCPADSWGGTEFFSGTSIFGDMLCCIGARLFTLG